MAQKGFNGQWIEVARVGEWIASKGDRVNLTPEILNLVAANFNDGQQAPLTIGHPKKGDPAYGWITELRMNGDRLEMLTEDTADEFEQMIKDGRFRTRSAGIWLTHPSLKAPTIDHVAFLGAEAPAVKGLRNIEFSEFADGESFVVEETLNLQEKKMEETDLDQLPESFWTKFKTKLGIGEKADLNEGQAQPSQMAQFSEANVREIVEEATKAVKTEFAEQITGLKAENEALKAKVDGQIAGGVRSEIAQFVDGLDARKGKHFLKRAHIADFLESLAVADAADAKAPDAICFSEGEGDDKTEFKSSRLGYMKTLLESIAPMVEFGEKFGNIVATKEADAMINMDRVNAMKDAVGVGTDANSGGAK